MDRSALARQRFGHIPQLLSRRSTMLGLDLGDNGVVFRRKRRIVVFRVPHSAACNPHQSGGSLVILGSA
ncbi:hypothetical protein [Brevundimonas naejangsanensis]|uniref:hypothetical protein n=1 Tax=Brevundimonas naejangsanensis TaxID=588932 RepID=UPI0026EB150B|nr:hypothetical protein [Brevundimonas naejangsanensis]